MRHFFVTSSAASSIRSVHWGKKKISKAWTCDEVFLTWGLFSLSCTLVPHGALLSQVAGRVCMTLRGTIHGSGCHLRICCLKKKYKIIRRISQVKRTKAASQYAVVSGFEMDFFQTIHLPESPGTTMPDPVWRRLSSVQARTPGWPHNFFQKRLHRHQAARQRE